MTEAQGGNTLVSASEEGGTASPAAKASSTAQVHAGGGAVLTPWLSCSSGALFAAGAVGRRGADVTTVRCHVCSAPR